MVFKIHKNTSIVHVQSMKEMDRDVAAPSGREHPSFKHSLPNISEN